MPAPTVTVWDAGSSEMESNCLRDIWAWVLSAMVLKEWPRPRARSLARDFDYLPDLVDGSGLVELIGVKSKVACPVGSGGGGCLFGSGDVARDHAAGKDSAGALEELPFVYGCLRWSEGYAMERCSVLLSGGTMYEISSTQCKCAATLRRSEDARGGEHIESL